jgi:hypothetical protein
MNKIKFIANKDTNYVFHMLSVAKCGYDNAYGQQYRMRYPQEDLAVFKINEELLTVCGGEHCGLLYGLMVGEPATAKISAKEYYNSLIEVGKAIISGNIPEKIDKDLIPYTDTILSLSEIMVKHYDDYIVNIWETEKGKIENYILKLQDYFEKSDFTQKAEELLGCQLQSDYFTATLVTSVEDGAEAIDISESQDVFGIERDYLDAVYFIGHEFIIYLLFEVLANENAFKNFETWSLTEGLAEYYLKKIMGDTRFFNNQQKYVEYYESCEKKAQLSAVELYGMALRADMQI